MCERLWVRTCVRFSGDCDSACRSAGLLVVCDICGSGCPQQEQTNPLLPAAPGVTLTCEYTLLIPNRPTATTRKIFLPNASTRGMKGVTRHLLLLLCFILEILSTWELKLIV